MAWWNVIIGWWWWRDIGFINKHVCNPIEQEICIFIRGAGVEGTDGFLEEGHGEELEDEVEMVDGLV